MSTSVAAIAKEAFDAAAAELPDVIKTGTLSRAAGSDTYNAATGQYVATAPQTASGRVLFATEQLGSAADPFPGYVASQNEDLVYLEGFSLIPVENDRMTVSGTVFAVVRGRDLLRAGGLSAAIVRPV
ncbi:MAG TPA: hypothetical protein VHL98_11070 [Microvirga sp.]|jgi:hypothetical protein|nr:hypothetical protein [Microvirga sp.]